ncbi:hypothetical protein HYT00_00375 [Candidatus Giovannonibacteria bacterium]|nr:hypothetical protein [Candidatus Giovannonibacteria bacterium]
MTDTSLLKYIEDARKFGSFDSEIRSSLENAGWQPADINQAFSELSTPRTTTPKSAVSPSPIAEQFSLEKGASSSFNWKIWAIVAASLFIVAGGGAYAAWNYFEMPGRAFSNMPMASQKIENLSYKFRINMESRGGKKSGDGVVGIPGLKYFLPAGLSILEEQTPLPPSFQKDAAFKADIDMSGAYEIPKGGEFPVFSTLLSAEVETGGVAIKLSGELRSVDEVAYFIINNFPGMFESELGDFELKKWYSLKQETLKNLGFFDGVNSNPIQETEETRKKTLELYGKYTLFDIAETKREKLSDGTPVYTYKLSARKKELLSYFDELSSISGGADLGEKKFYEDFVDGLSNGGVELKISRVEHYLREASFDVTDVDIEGQKVDMDISLEFSEINKSSIEKPASAFAYDEILEKMMEDNKKMARDYKRAADIAGLRVSLELYYDAHNKYPTSLLLIDKLYLPEIPMDPAGGQYFYAKTKNGYHLGANMEYKGTYLNTDADNKIGFDGADSKGCKGELNRYCFDVVSP